MSDVIEVADPAVPADVADVDSPVETVEPPAAEVAAPVVELVPEPAVPAEPSTLEELRLFVHYRLCARENLLEDQFTTADSPIVRGGQSCGLQFQLQGPRSVRLSAVWTSDRNEVYLYDAAGERYEKIALKRRIAA